jgi:hypothetical protein
MKLSKKFTLYFFVFFYAILILWAGNEWPPDFGIAPIQVKIQSVGRVKIITNLGYFATPQGYKVQTKNSLNKPLEPTQNYCYPGSRNAMFLGGKRGNKKIFTNSEWWNYDSPYVGHEFFPTNEPWDTIYVVDRDEVVDIPYWPGYKGISDEDFVCRFNDYQYKPPDQVMPLGVEVIQVVHGWGIPSYNLWSYIEWYIIAKQDDIDDLHFGWWTFTGIGVYNVGGSTHDDDIRYFDEELEMAFHEDLPGNNDDSNDDCMLAGPLGFKIWTPEDVPKGQLKWSFNNRRMPSIDDNEWYDLLSSGNIDPPSSDPNPVGVKGFSTVSVGPFDLKQGDTLHIRLAQVVGIEKEGVVENLSRLEDLIARNFALPTSPPPPPLRIESGNHQATLRWDALPGEVNPETCQDRNREDFDTEPQPFEGYRIYKSFNESGPYQLLDQYDVEGNEFEPNTGLVREYTDYGLLNNVEYFYSVTAFSKEDLVTGFQSLESGIQLSRVRVIPGTQVPESVGEVFVVPNPYRGDLNYGSYKPPWETPDPIRNQENLPGRDRWTEYDRRIQFVNVPSPSEVKIYSLAGDHIRTLYHNNPDVGILDWNLTSTNGLTVASGIFLFTVEDKNNGKTQVGKFVIIK